MPQAVAPPSRQGETGTVVRAAVVLVVLALLWIGWNRTRGGGGDPGAALLPYQVRFADLTSAQQRVVRELHEGALEALRLRGESGRWPDVARLASDGIPPFSDDGVDRGARRFASRTAPYAFEYVGLPARADADAVLIQIFEPTPSSLEGRDPAVPVAEDEQHRLLPDGTLLHVSFWIADPAVKPAAKSFVQEPALEGWQQVLSRTPPKEKP